MAQTFGEWWQDYHYEFLIPSHETLKSVLERAYCAGKEVGYLQGVHEAQEKVKATKRTPIEAVGGFLVESGVLDGRHSRRWVPSMIPLENEIAPVIPQPYY